MTQLPIISGSDAVRTFEKVGWVVARQRGSHVILTKHGRRANLSVPQHKALDPGTIRGLIRDAGMSVSEFVSLI